MFVNPPRILKISLFVSLSVCVVFIQAQRRLSAYRWPLSHALIAHAKRLAQHARESNLVLFLGAGVSMGCGLPNWDGLLNALATHVGLGPTVPDAIENVLARAKQRIAAIEGNTIEGVVGLPSVDVKVTVCMTLEIVLPQTWNNSERQSAWAILPE